VGKNLSGKDRNQGNQILVSEIPKDLLLTAYEPCPVLGAKAIAVQVVIPPGSIAMKNWVVAHTAVLPVRVSNGDPRPFALYGIGEAESLQPLGFGHVHTLSDHFPTDSVHIRPIADLDELEPASLPALLLRFRPLVLVRRAGMEIGTGSVE